MKLRDGVTIERHPLNMSNEFRILRSINLDKSMLIDLAPNTKQQHY